MIGLKHALCRLVARLFNCLHLQQAPKTRQKVSKVAKIIAKSVKKSAKSRQIEPQNHQNASKVSQTPLEVAQMFRIGVI